MRARALAAVVCVAASLPAAPAFAATRHGEEPGPAIAVAPVCSSPELSGIEVTGTGFTAGDVVFAGLQIIQDGSLVFFEDGTPFGVPADGSFELAAEWEVPATYIVSIYGPTIPFLVERLSVDRSRSDQDETDPPVGGPPLDTTAPNLKLDPNRKKSDKRKVVVDASCDEDCSVRIENRGKATLKRAVVVAKRKKKLRLEVAEGDIAGGESERFKLRFEGRRTARLVKRTLRRNKGKIVLKLRGTAVDAAGNKGKDGARVTLR